MHSNHRPRPRRKKHLTVTKRLLASSQLSSPLPTELINELTELNPNGPELPRGRAPIHNTFLMSFDVELPFLQVLPPFLSLFPDANGRMIRFVFVTIFCLSALFCRHHFAFCLLPLAQFGGRLAKSLFMILFQE